MSSILPARFPEDRAIVETLFREYQQGLSVSLDFQSFDEEVALLPGKYAPPGGGILLARMKGEAAGSVAWYRLAPEIAEIKRLYVRPAFRGVGLGKALLERVIGNVRAAGYRKLYLDSLHRLAEARKLYESFDFRDIPPYNVNPEPDVYYMELDLCASTTTPTPT